MAIHDDRLETYLEDLAHPGHGVLARMGEEGRAAGFPIVGPQVGRLLQQIVQMTQAKRIFELGSGFGYSTLWFALNLPPDGVIHHTDGDAKNSERARAFLTEAGVVDKVRFHVGNAMEILTDLDDPEPFDIVFCDVDKDGYPWAYDVMRKRVRVGGCIVIDNLVWSGKVADESVDDASTRGIREYTQRMWNDGDFLSSLMPVRDGVGLHVRLR